ncbi:transcription factor HES-1 [Tachyglossus aculeatus]|uniref:transcription factor HES-1 n=1 Tax=Tachyglossus aculeatus TaxID=9261 RepID=UPI0018F606DC|nr:transcription factor HES-1 [Tachyglossus aculeatus]
MPADIMEKNSSSPVAATPASVNTTPDKPKTASEHRKSSKPIMEKRRRARINESLSQLKTLILDALKKDSSRHSKLEKADILEMTVKHLRNLQRAQMTAALSSDPTVLGKYRAGFSQCINEVTRFLSTCEGVNADVRTRLLGHLDSCVAHINAIGYPAHAPFGHTLVQLPGTAAAAAAAAPPGGGGGAGGGGGGAAGAAGGGGAGAGGAGMPCKATSPNPDPGKMLGGFQVVPAPDGQFAFLIPNAAFAPNGPVLPLYPHSGLHPAGPSAPSPITADSVWRPW